MTSEPVVGVVFGCPVVGKMILSYICLPFHSPTQASQLTGTSSSYRFRCHCSLITYLSADQMKKDNSKEGTSSRNIQTYNSKSVLYYVVQCPTQLVGASAYKANRSRAGNTGTPAARTPRASVRSARSC